MEGIAEDATVAPPVTHKLHTHGIEIILGADGLHQRKRRGRGRRDGIGAAAEKSRGSRPVFPDDRVCPFGNFPVGLLPGDALVMIAHTFFGKEQPVPIFREVLRRSALPAAVAVGSRAGGIRTDVDDPVVLHLHLQPAGDGAEITPCFFPFAQGYSSSSPHSVRFFDRMP